MLDTRARKYLQKGFDTVAKKSFLIKIHPNAVTVLAFLLGITSAGLVAMGLYLPAVALLWLSGLLDVLDGTVARLTGKTSNIGAYLDLVFDRMVECAVIFGFYIALPQFAISYYLFYIGAMFNFSTFMLAGNLFKNTGKKSMHYDIGIVERSESFIFFTLMMIFPDYIFITLNIFNALMLLTGIIRMAKIIRHELGKESKRR